MHEIMYISAMAMLVMVYLWNSLCDLTSRARFYEFQKKLFEDILKENAELKHSINKAAKRAEKEAKSQSAA
jgi:hypothetical protein